MNNIEKNVLITGVSRGIGLTTAELCLDSGYSVKGISRTCPDKLLAHNHFEWLDADLSDLENVERISKTLSSELFHTAVMNAGGGLFGNLEELSKKDIHRLFNLNLFQNIHLTQAILPAMKKSGKGQLIFIGSEAALKGSQKGSIYCSSKFALRGFTQSLRAECARSGVKVTLINPGMVKSAFYESESFSHGEDPENYITTSEVARIIEFVMKSSDSSVIEEINLNPLKKVIQFKK